ncbi:MAG TPA: 30S ribosomal protein S7 [Candidatus Bilamarchaeaceae archaeon]|nr:30S ribosomal protein S7 [Candidatus Bilamarchaeaceae archaeon]
MTQKIFGKYDNEGIEIKDLSLAQVISLHPVVIPHTSGRHAKKPLGKMHVNIVERLANKLMRGGTGEKTSGKVIRTHGKMQGKKFKALRIVEAAFETVATETKENPVQVLVRAVENAAPHEDVTRVSFGGVSYQIAVDISATRRLDMALRNIALAAILGSFNKGKRLSQSLSAEIMNTAKGDIQTSYAMKKRDETERMARSAR